MRPQLNPLILGPGAPWSLPGSSLDIQFTTGRAAVNRQKSSISSLLTTTRASTGYAATSTGLLVLFPTNTPRITDLGLLVEQAATNIVLQSNTFSTTWATINGASVTANSATDPTNANNGWLLASASNFAGVQQSTTIVSGTTYTASAFCKAGTTHVVAVEFRDITSTNIVRVKADLNAGTVTGTSVAGSGALVASGIIPFGNGWYRVWVAGTITSTAGGMAIADNANAPINVDVFGAQLELGSFATSYIPTTTVSVTRAADSISLTTAASNLIPITTATLLFNMGAVPWGNDGADHILLAFLQSGSTPGVGKFSGGTIAFNDGVGYRTSQAYTNSAAFKYAVAYGGSDINSSLGGGTVSNYASYAGSIAGTAKPYKIGSGSGSAYWNGTFKRITVFSSQLSGAQLQALTQ